MTGPPCLSALLLVAFATFAPGARAQEPAEPGATIPSDPVFTALLIDGE